MSKNQRYFRGTLRVRSGQYEHDVTYLLVANTQKRAWAVLEEVAANFYGDDAPMEDGGYFFNAGEVYVRTTGVLEIGLAQFLALKGVFSVRCDANAQEPTSPEADQVEGFKAFAKSATDLLKKRGVAVSHSVMLETLAGALGAKNWQVLNDKLTAKPQHASSSTQSSTGLLQLQQELLEEIGFSFSQDSDQPGLWVWQAVSDGCDISFGSLQEALGDAWASAASQAREAFQMDETQWNAIGFLRQRELLRQLAGQDGTQEATYEVDLCRIGYGQHTVTVRATNEEQARELALNEAGNHEYTEKSSEYEVNGVRKL